MAPTNFCNLPPELRNVIYQEVLPKQPRLVGIKMRDKRHVEDRDVWDITPGIFFTNEQIFSEVVTFFTGFTFGEGRDLHMFLEQLGPSAKHLRHIVCRTFIDIDIFRGIIHMLSQTTSLQKLEVANALTDSTGWYKHRTAKQWMKMLDPLLYGLGQARDEEVRQGKAKRSVADVISIQANSWGGKAADPVLARLLDEDVKAMIKEKFD